MIDDVLDILRSEGRLMDPDEIRDALIWRDPIRYRTAQRRSVIDCINRLKTQGFIIDTEYIQEGGSKFAFYRFVGVEA